MAKLWPSYCQVIEMLMPIYCHVIVMLLSSYSQFIGNLLPRYCQVIAKLLLGLPQVSWLEKSYPCGVAWVVFAKDKDGSEPIKKTDIR